MVETRYWVVPRHGEPTLLIRRTISDDAFLVEVLTDERGWRRSPSAFSYTTGFSSDAFDAAEIDEPTALMVERELRRQGESFVA